MMLKITRNQTPTFFATLATANGAPFDVADFESGTFTIYKSTKFLLSSVPSQFLQPVAGFADAEIPVSAIIASETVENLGLNYNFKFAPNVTETFPFADVGIYFVEFRVNPQIGNPIVWQRAIQVV